MGPGGRRAVEEGLAADEGGNKENCCSLYE